MIVLEPGMASVSLSEQTILLDSQISVSLEIVLAFPLKPKYLFPHPLSKLLSHLGP